MKDRRTKAELVAALAEMEAGCVALTEAGRWEVAAREHLQVALQDAERERDEANRALATRQNHGSRERLPDERPAVTRKITVLTRKGEVDVYLTIGFQPDGRPGEVFVTVGKEGDETRGYLDAWAQAASLALQYGVPLAVLAGKQRHRRFGLHGRIANPWAPSVHSCTSLLDAVGAFLEWRFGA